jgi:hypothetical protein
MAAERAAANAVSTKAAAVVAIPENVEARELVMWSKPAVQKAAAVLASPENVVVARAASQTLVSSTQRAM